MFIKEYLKSKENNLKGKLTSYLDVKKFGFIKGEDNEDYFFHFNDLINKGDVVKLKKGANVKFDPIPTKKGLAAKKVTVSDKIKFKKKLVSGLIKNKNYQPNHGCVEVRKTITTSFFKNIDDAKNNLESIARKTNANAILNIKYESKTFNSGNYRYTQHAYTADLAIVSELEQCGSDGKNDNCNKELNDRINSFKGKFEQEKEIEAKKRHDQEKISPFFFVIVVFMFLIWIYLLF